MRQTEPISPRISHLPWGHIEVEGYPPFKDAKIFQRYFAGIANIGDVSFHAGLKAALARLGVCAKLFHVRRTRPWLSQP